MRQQINEILKSLEKASEDLYNIESNTSDWNTKCDLTEAIRSTNTAIHRLELIASKEQMKELSRQIQEDYYEDN